MLIVRGTKKLRDRVRATAPSGEDVATTALGEWYATALFWRPQVALLVNETTLLPVFLPLAPAATLLDRVPDAIASVLRGHGVDQNFVVREREAMTDVRLAPTSNRSVVGMMNEFAFLGEVHWKGGLCDDLEELSIGLARTPCGPLYVTYVSPDRALAALVGGTTPSARTPHLRLVTDETAPSDTRRSVTKTVYQLKVAILDTKPPVWRRVLVPGDITLAELHDVIQAAFGWWNYHLHEFEFGRTRYGVPSDDDWGDSPKDERTVRLSTVAKEGSTFRYTYDFGDDWRHKITVEKVTPLTSDTIAPALIDGRRACPPEDCGGPWGYKELLDVLADPKHPDHTRHLEWVGGTFDPDAFDPSDFDEKLTLGGAAMFDE